ncbi:MAG: methyltransferase domain-containing protein [Alphaproteobacteria bacterium]|nr:methyltransferase domain-containing protein [Alphaproteobacteria bacterium]
MESEKVIAHFPKTRPALPAAQVEIFEQEMITNREGTSLMTSLAQKLESWMHVNVAKRTTGRRLLELGAGTLNHLKYLDASKRDSLDAIEPMTVLYKDSPEQKQVRTFYNDISECTASYDTIYSIAVLEHITNLPTVIARAALLLEEGGQFINGIPCEGGLLWGLSWRCSTGVAYRLRTGFSYKNIMRHEHVNSFDEIVTLVRHFFDEVDVSYFPLAGKHLAFYACISAKSPKRSVASTYLA